MPEVSEAHRGLKVQGLSAVLFILTQNWSEILIVFFFSDFEIESSIKEDATQVICKDMEQHRAFIEKSKRVVFQNVDPGKYHKRDYISGRQWENLHGIGQGKLVHQPRDLGKAIVCQRPFVGKRPFRLLRLWRKL